MATKNTAKKANGSVTGSAKTFRLGEYNGNPMLYFGDAEDRFPFGFGIAKAKKLRTAMTEIGAEKFLAVLVEFTK